MTYNTTIDLTEDLRTLANIAEQVATRRDVVFSLTDGNLLYEAADEIEILMALASQLYVALTQVTYIPNHNPEDESGYRSPLFGSVLAGALRAMDEYDNFNAKRTYLDDEVI